MTTNQKKNFFIVLSSVLSVLHALGYVWHGYQTGFNICIYAMIVLDLLYIPSVLIKGYKSFPFYLVLFSFVLVFITAFTTSKLYNNYSGLLCLFVAVMIFPRFKNVFMASYLIICSIAFTLCGDPVYYLIIHTSRTLWIFSIYTFILFEQYNRKPVVLFDDERRILEQLCDNKLQKEIELDGYSESTIRRRISTAMKRNNVKDIEELKELYLKTYKKAE